MGRALFVVVKCTSQTVTNFALLIW